MNLVRVALLALVLASAIAGPVVGQATPGPGNATNNSSAANTSTPTTGPAGPPGPNGSANGSNESTTTAAPGAPQAPNGSGSDGLDLGVPSAGDVAGEAVNGTLDALNQVFVDTVGTILKLPWRFITLRFAPFEAIGDASGDGGLWQRPPGVFGELYDLATGFAFEIATSLLVIFLVIDWLGNFSPKPGAVGPIDRLMYRAGDVAHLLFSWPIIWVHFLLASILCVLFLPPDSVVVGGLTGSFGQLAGVGALVGFTLVFSIVLAIIAGYLLLKHAGAFVYLLAGLAAYPILVAASIPDHPVVGRLGEYAENARSGVVVAAWYPTPTAFVLGVGYWIDQAVIAALTLGGPLGEISGGAIYYPVLWLAALYAPEKVFGNGSPTRKARNMALAAGMGGAAGAATGATAGTAAGMSAGALAGSASGAAGSLPAGAGAGAATSAGAGSVSATASRMSSGSPGASALADGGTRPIASGGGDGAGPLGGGSAGSTAQEPDGLTRIGSRDEIDTGQRYEPVVQKGPDNIEELGPEPPNDANWLVDQGGADRLDRGTDEPLYFRGESDGELYDLRGASNAGGVHGEASSGNKDSIRDL